MAGGLSRNPVVGVDILSAVAGLVERWQGQAGALDQSAAFPRGEVQDLREVGALLAPVPTELGGAGWGTQPSGARPLMALLRLIGQGNLAVGRVFEGHVNALQLISRYGSAAQARRAALAAADGHLFAIWNTEAAAPVRLAADGRLRGKKIFCSAAGEASRALITVQVGAADGATRMVTVQLEPGERVGPETWLLQGMRACGTGSMHFDGLAVSDDDLIGVDGDYVRQPVFSAGAWRTSAVTLGGLQALTRAARTQLRGRGREQDAYQRQRMGRALIAEETARLWVRRAADIAEGNTAMAADVVGVVNLARIAVETACLEAMVLAQRSLGLAGLLQGNAVERILRDLTTYLRQPAPDETLAEAAAHFMDRELPDAG